MQFEACARSHLCNLRGLGIFTGRKIEVSVQGVLSGSPIEKLASRDSMWDPLVFEPFVNAHV